MAKAPLDIPAVAGSLSHSRFNCGMRNIVARKQGCECPMQETCKCNLRVICDDQGMFNLALVKAKDEEWGDLCEKGITWEMLSPDMDVEEPEAALVISIALNKNKLGIHEDSAHRNHEHLGWPLQAVTRLPGGAIRASQGAYGGVVWGRS